MNFKNKFFLLSLRTFFLQVLWNFEKMQNIGFAFILMPELKKIYKDDSEGYNRAIIKHLEFFNIHPYMVGIVVGIVMRIEEKIYTNKEDILNYEKDICSIKSTMAGPLSAIGDLFFWGILRPIVALIVLSFFVLFCLFVHDYRLRVFFVIFSYLFFYNIPHFLVRFEGLKKSYEMGTNVIIYIKKWHDLDVDKKFKKLGSILTVIMFYFFCRYQGYSFVDILKCICVVFIFDILKKKNKMTTIQLIFYIVIFFVLIVYLKVG